MTAQPVWVCKPCGDKFGNKTGVDPVWHEDFCGVCGELAAVVDPVELGGLKPGWHADGKKK